MIALFVGENSFEIERAVAMRCEQHDGAAEIIDGEALTTADLPDVLTGATLFSTSRLVIIRHLSLNNAAWSALDDWLPRIDPESEVIFVETKPDKRTKTYKRLVGHADVKEFPAWTVRDSGAAERWTVQEAARLGYELDAKSARHLVARVGVDQWRLASELDKLAVIETVTPMVIDQVVEATPSENVFLLFSTALDGNRAKIAELIAALRLSEDPYMVFGLLSGQALQLAVLVSTDAPSGEVARAIGVHPFALSKLSPYARNLSTKQAKKIVTAFADTDASMKTTAVDPWLHIERVLQSITT
ncbi:MAG: DNA polymerase III subunit delta [Candidatus Saccharimonadales bacterium]